MNSFKQKVSELRKNTPRHIQWLLLGAAFVVVLILLTILLGGKDDNNQEIAQMNTAPAELKIEPEMINWADVIVGEKKEQKIIINATAPVIVKEVAQVKDKQNDDVNRFVSTRSTCEGQKIDTAVACNITVSYTPSTPMQTIQARIIVKWHRAEDAEDMTMTDDIVLTLGANAPVIEEKPIAKPEPVPEPEPKVEEEITEEEIVEEEEPETIQEEIVREIETIAPPVVTPSKTETKKEIVIPDGCSDFAFPAYNNSGRQIGWVKPSGGAYYYHSFDDKNCTDPSGTYNPDNGIITDDSGKKIGTDADHIGYATIASGILPELSNTPAVKPVYRARQKETGSESRGGMGRTTGEQGQSIVKPAKKPDVEYKGTGVGSITSSKQQDRQFILRQFKPIPATIVSDVRADPQTLANNKLPVRATVDRNVYSDNGRNVIIPTGTLLLGYVDGELPGPYTSIGRMDIKWYQFVLPNGVEFNFNKNNVPFSGDAQGRSGIPGYGSTDYLEQFFMPMLTAIVPAAVNLIAPISDKFVNQIDLDNNTVVQSGTVRSSELAKNEIVTAWNQVAQKLMVDMMDNTVPPFTIAAGTRITVYSPVDLIASCGEEGDGKICSLGYGKENRLDDWSHSIEMADDSSWVGQVRSFAVNKYCTTDGKVNPECKGNKCGGYDYATLLFYCQSSQYKAINIARQEQIFKNQMDETNTNSINSISSQGDKAYNEQVLGLTYNEETGAIENPFNKPAPAVEEVVAAETLLCLDGTAPDANGCCTGEIYTDMGEQGFNCCPETGGDCFPPML